MIDKLFLLLMALFAPLTLAVGEEQQRNGVVSFASITVNPFSEEDHSC
ncbi:MAG: hypothetical protein QX198_02920 [Methylococcaceae bacterium]